MVIAFEPKPIFDHAILQEAHLFREIDQGAAAEGHVESRKLIVAEGDVVYLVQVAYL